MFMGFVCTHRLCFRRYQWALSQTSSLSASYICSQILNNEDVSHFPEATETWLCVQQNILPNSLFLLQVNKLKPNCTTALCSCSNMRVNRILERIAPAASIACHPPHVSYATLRASFAMLSWTIIHHETTAKGKKVQLYRVKELVRIKFNATIIHPAKHYLIMLLFHFI